MELGQQSAAPVCNRPAPRMAEGRRKTGRDPTRQTDPHLVLMADDDEDYFVIVRHALRASGTAAKLVHLCDGQALLDYLARREENLPALILLDIRMPTMDGRETLNRLKADPCLCDIPVVMLTGGREDRAKPPSSLGAEAFFNKPPAFDQWVELMKLLADQWLPEG